MKNQLQGLLLLCAATSLLSVTGCGTDDGGPSSTLGAACTEEARSSVSVKIVTGSGTIVPDAMITFSVDGGPAQACENMSGGNYVCGYEVAGSITVTATKDGMTQTQTVTIVKTADGCHVQGQTITITLGA